MEHIWNPFLTFCVIVAAAGLLYELLEIWRLYASRPKCRCKCGTEDKR